MIQAILLEEDGTRNYLVFQPIYRYFKQISSIGNGNYIYYWPSKGLSDERINSIKPVNLSITPFLDYYRTKRRLEFNGSCLKQDKITYSHEKIVNVYISDYPTLENCLFGAVTLTKTADIDKYGYCGYDIEVFRILLFQ